jgi:four helix bundle protein
LNGRENRAQNYRHLAVWQKGKGLCLDVYRTTQAWPKSELYGLTSQVNRAAVSIPSNIAEGQGRFGPAEMARYVSIAHGSLCELETQLEIAAELGFPFPVSLESLLEQSDELGRMLRALHRTLSMRK